MKKEKVNGVMPAELKGDPLAQSGYMGMVTKENVTTVKTPNSVTQQKNAVSNTATTQGQNMATVQAPKMATVEAPKMESVKSQIAYLDEGKTYTPYGEKTLTTTMHWAEDNDPNVVQYGRSGQGNKNEEVAEQLLKKNNIVTAKYGEYRGDPDVQSRGIGKKYYGTYGIDMSKTLGKIKEEAETAQMFQQGIWNGEEAPKKAKKIVDDGSWLTAEIEPQEEDNWLTDEKVSALGEFAGTMDYMGDTYAQSIWNIVNVDTIPGNVGRSKEYKQENNLSKIKLSDTGGVKKVAKTVAKESLGIADAAINAVELVDVGRTYGTDSKEFEQKLAATAIDVAVDVGAKVLATAAGAAALTIGMPAAVLAVVGITVAGGILSIMSDDIAGAFMESNYEEMARRMVPLEMQYYQQVDELVKTYGAEATIEATKNMYL